MEAKGKFTAKDRKILLSMRVHWPDVDLRILFALNNKLSKNTETRYADWCESHDITYAFKTVPEDWL